ncbi:MAG: hypothetical protein LBM17_08805 [Candidatus Accumulibacter sp.]|jgi:hypothetical protein|nr:hypothetical protein [Accumulibacter sp.]
MVLGRVAAVGVLSFAVSLAHAARPMNTDDARVVDSKACQLETWTKKTPGGSEHWALPACNFTGNLEVTLGGLRGRNEHIRDTATVFQGKTLFKSLETNGWAWGLVFGNAHRSKSSANTGLSSERYAYIPASFSFRDDRFILHTNVGWSREKAERKDRMTWGVGSETRLTGSTWLIAETFGQNHGKPFYQVGLRHWLVPDRVQIDATFGDRIDGIGGERWFSIGLRLLSPSFLP